MSVDEVLVPAREDVALPSNASRRTTSTCRSGAK